MLWQKFLHTNFSDVRFSDGYCFATYEGSEDTFNDRLEKFISITVLVYEGQKSRTAEHGNCTPKIFFSGKK